MSLLHAARLRSVVATRYVLPLREGGSLPAIVEADDEGLYVLKFRGAGQGVKALVAELVVGELARALGLAVPEIVFADLDAELARTEPDPEIQALIRASAGRNLALDYLPGAVTFDPLVQRADPEFASRLVWFDACVMNIDRTARNANMLWWHDRPWLIDHGAALYFHHDWVTADERARTSFPAIRDHVLLEAASWLREVDADMRETLSPSVVARVLALVPDAWLVDAAAGHHTEHDAAHCRSHYARLLDHRIAHASAFVEEATRARALLV